MKKKQQDLLFQIIDRWKTPHNFTQTVQHSLFEDGCISALFGSPKSNATF